MRLLSTIVGVRDLVSGTLIVLAPAGRPLPRRSASASRSTSVTPPRSARCCPRHAPAARSPPSPSAGPRCAPPRFPWPGLKVAVIGSGVSGLTAAHVLARRGNEVTLYERDARFGGHSNTVAVPGERGEVGVDTGFIVHNRRTYPHLIRLFDELGVETQPSDMSFGVRCDGCGLEYAGARGVRGVLATPAQPARPSYLRMLAEVRRFHRARPPRAASTRPADRLTLGEFLDRRRLLRTTAATTSCCR